MCASQRVRNTSDQLFENREIDKIVYGFRNSWRSIPTLFEGQVVANQYNNKTRWQLSVIIYYLHGFNLGKDAIKEVKSGGLSSTLQDLETFTTYYLKVAAFTKVHILYCVFPKNVFPKLPVYCGIGR